MTETDICKRGGAVTARGRALLCAAIAVVALCAGGSSAWAATPNLELLNKHDPTNVPILKPVNQVWTVEVLKNPGLPNVGRFRLIITLLSGREVKTHAFRFNAEAKEIEEALEEKKGIESGNVKVEKVSTDVEGGAGYGYQITFVGALAGKGVELIEAESLEATAGEEKEVEKKEPPETPEEAEFETELTQQAVRDKVVITLAVHNPSKEATSGTITVKDTLPSGFVTGTEGAFGQNWTCKPEGEDASTIECKTSQVVNPDGQIPAIEIEAVPTDAEALKEGQTLTNKAEMTWESTRHLTVEDTLPISNSPPPFGVRSFIANSYNAEGALDEIAGDHPYQATTSFFFNTVNHFNTATETLEIVSPQHVQNADVILPEGFIGNPAGGRLRCTQAEFTAGNIGNPGFEEAAGCPPEAQVGVVYLYVKGVESPQRLPVYNLVPPDGAPAEFGFIIFSQVPVRIDAHVVKLNGKYRVTALSADINEAYNIDGVTLTLWGVPADSSHNAERIKVNHREAGASSSESPVRPFLTNPTDCLQTAEEVEKGTGPLTSLFYDSWETPGPLNGQGEPETNGPHWLEIQAKAPAVKECDKLSFAPESNFKPEPPAQPGHPEEGGTTKAAAPSGYEFNLEIPQDESPTGRATPQLKDTVVTLPPGLTLSPSAANGLVGCDAVTELKLDSTLKGECPAASQVGEVHILSNLLEEELIGRVYLGKPECDPCHEAEVAEGKLIHLYIEAEAPKAGVRVKLPGNARIDQATGQVISTFAENPQVPFTKLTLTLKGGERASLANPVLCGNYVTSALFTPWSLAGSTPGAELIGGNAAVENKPSVAIDWDGAGGAVEACPPGLSFAPSFIAGTQNTAAGEYTDFETVFARGDDREQAFSSKAGIVVHTPLGLLGKINGVTKCEAPEVEAMIKEQGSCPANSEIAEATSAAGPGSEPFVASGPVYLTGPYTSSITGASGPFGLAIAVPAKTKAFNLGTVIVRAAISINPQTSAITIVSDPPPLAKDGIPLRVKQIAVHVNRKEFMFNATNCEPKSITTTLTGEPAAGEPAGVVERSAFYQPTNCGALPFAPKFSATTSGKASKREGTSFVVKVEQQRGEANIGKVEVQLPENLPSRLETLQEACADSVFEKNPAECPEHSVVGSATARTPLLSSPLTGPAYLVSHAGLAFPDLVFLLQGEGVHIEIVGHTDIKNSITYSKFETVPDAPIDSFETVFPKGRYSILGAVGNLCELELFAPTTIISQSNKRFEQKTAITVSECGPTVGISKVRVSGHALLVTVKTSAAGSIRIAGKGLKTATTRSKGRETKVVRVRFSKSGVALAKHKKKIKLTVTVSAGGQNATKSASVKL